MTLTAASGRLSTCTFTMKKEKLNLTNFGREEKGVQSAGAAPSFLSSAGSTNSSIGNKTRFHRVNVTMAPVIAGPCRAEPTLSSHWPARGEEALESTTPSAVQAGRAVSSTHDQPV